MIMFKPFGFLHLFDITIIIFFFFIWDEFMFSIEKFVEVCGSNPTSPSIIISACPQKTKHKGGKTILLGNIGMKSLCTIFFG